MINFKKNIFLTLAILLSGVIFAQQPYYNGVNFTLSGLALKTELAQKITISHTTLLTYSNVWDVLKQTDLDPGNSAKVLLLYGYNDTDGSLINDRTRNKTNNGGSVGDWNREHTYAQSLATPSMFTSGPNSGTDAHHLRSCDVQMNGNRSNRKFATGSGNAGTAGTNWYPGDEWKGDVARMMMYMYLRYPTQCKPINVGTGSAVAIDASMLTLFLDWNAQDPVSTYEQNRNTILETSQGNRNPFIDNPYLATIIWGGTPAQNFWPALSVSEKSIENSFTVYPVPSNRGNIHLFFNFNTAIKLIKIYSINGQIVRDIKNPKLDNNEFIINNLEKGFFLLKASIGDKIIIKKIIVN